MNDAAVEEPIADAESQYQRRTRSNSEHPKDYDQPQETDDQHTQATKWWYASTGFPLLAGTFGPMANAFSICALVENWRVDIPPGQSPENAIDVPDPRWLIAVNAVSLAFALTANLSLLLNMARRIKFEIAQPITILGFWMASILLIGLIGYAGTSTSFHIHGSPTQALSQAYYYAIFAAALYQIISYLMCVTVYGAYKGVYPKDFELTPAQRTLMLQTISFLVYMHLGALVYAHIEGWRFLDAVYWADFTLLTVGIGGKYVPATHLGRGLLFPFAIGGIIIIGLVVSSIRSLVLERGAQKMSARMREKVRQRVVRQIKSIEAGNKHILKSPFFINQQDAQNLTQKPSHNKADELERRQTEFEVMRRVQDMAAREKQYTSLFVSSTAFAILWFIGALIFYKSETDQDWTYYASLYFSYTSILTIGYGDLTPESDSGRSFFVFWSLLAVPTLTVLISNMGDTVVKGVKDITLYLGEITVLPSDDHKVLDRVRYGLYKATLGQFKIGKPKQDVETGKSNSEDEDENEDEQAGQASGMPPGLVPLFDTSGGKQIEKKDLQVLDKLAQIWRMDEEESEENARRNHDRKNQIEHHYRRLLITQIPKVYGHSRLSSPKKYTYIEWSFYLRLLGEDESDSSRHILAPITHHQKSGHKEKQNLDDATHTKEQNQKSGSSRPQWSWIGRRSPLMSDKSEAEWILERLFLRLEESFRTQAKAEMDQNQSRHQSSSSRGSSGSSSDSSKKSASPGDNNNGASGSNIETLAEDSLRKRQAVATQEK